jgi:hypothetical protein
MIVSGAVLAGISVGQHQRHNHAVAVQAEVKAQVDRAAVAEAHQFQAAAPPQARPQARPLPAAAPPQAHQASVSAKVDRRPPGDAQPIQAAALVEAANRPATAAPPVRHSPPPRSRPLGVTSPGAVSVVRGAGATLVIPALQVRAPVVATGAVDGSMTIPADIHTVGWYNGIDSVGGHTAASASTPWPGQPGVSLLAGHVDWAGEGPGALYYIGQLRAGDPIEVIGSNRVATYWRVSEAPITISKAALPAGLFLNSGPPKLALVTCGGPFDAATGHYLDNVIVWATLTTR